MPSIALEKSLPSDWAGLSTKDRTLVDRLPRDYWHFLERTNGGFVVAGTDACFNVPIERRHEGKITSIVETNDVEEFFALIPFASPYVRSHGKVPASMLHEHWIRHASEEFLPVDVVVFASCTANCLLAMSLNADDFGSVYYWEWYWRYPWFATFFKNRIQQAESRFADIGKVLADRAHPDYAKAFNALNYATLIKVAGSFSEFIESLEAAPAID